MFYIDPLYIWIFIITLVISIGAQLFIRSAYNKWSKVRNSAGMTGAQVGQEIVRRTSLGDSGYSVPDPRASKEISRLADLKDKGVITEEEYRAKTVQLERTSASTVASSIHFERIGGAMTDHYDPRSHTVRMSDSVATQPSVSAMAIVAHELGHAEQHEQSSIFISMRNVLLPAVRFSPQVALLLIFVGLFFNLVGLLWIGIFFYALMVVFTILTLPVEIDASRRGLRLLRESGLMQSEDDARGSRQVLTAAASTYIAAAVTAILQLLYYISLANRRR
jgi:hypothetical protein